MIALVLVAVATAILLGWVFARTSFEFRVTRPLAGARIGSAALAALRAPAASAPAQEQRAGGEPDTAIQDDVELAVRERLYGAHARPRR